MKNLFLLIALVLSFNSKADMTDWRGEVIAIKSMSDLAKQSEFKLYLSMFVRDCKALRSDSEQCELSSTEPVLATIHLTFLADGATLLPIDSDIKLNDFVVSQAHDGFAPKITEKLSKETCKWGFRLLNAGALQLECKDDAEKGWKQGTSMMYHKPVQNQ